MERNNDIECLDRREQDRRACDRCRDGLIGRIDAACRKIKASSEEIQNVERRLMKIIGALCLAAVMLFGFIVSNLVSTHDMAIKNNAILVELKNQKTAEARHDRNQAIYDALKDTLKLP